MSKENLVKLMQAADEARIDRDGELSDADLEAVAGGLMGPEGCQPPGRRNIGSSGRDGFRLEIDGVDAGC